ncbi:MAG: LPS-assembly protein LptD [Gammaproteobacteria bacterium]|nr:LPS-assembly protein LptD [Gammaproteobacteria bacterium]MBU1415139.1 LPS-assembly protein LptD [Gammaproteobacteria bacterium]
MCSGPLAAGALAQTATPRTAEPGPAEVSADSISGRSDVETIAEGNAEFRRDDTAISADTLIYRHLEDEVEATGNVRMKKNGDLLTGPHLRLQVQDNLGVLDQPAYVIKRPPKVVPGVSVPREPDVGSGEAERLDFEGEGVYRLKKSTFTTCTPNRDWYIVSDEMSLDYNRQTGVADSTKVVFMDTPIFYWPWFSFSLNNQRKSGFLSPSYATSTTSGLEFSLPWYWNIAPNMDATIAPRILARRGLQLNSELRYLDYSYNGQARFEYLPNDRVAGIDRSAYAIVHSQALAPGLTADLNLNGASDDSYFADLSSRVAMVSQANLLRQGRLMYGAGWWNATLMVQRYQTLQDPDAPVAVPYFRLPQFMLTAIRPDLPGGLQFNLTGEYDNFHHPTQVIGQRALLYPQVSLPMQTEAFYITPKVGVHYTRYNLDRQTAGVPDSLSRSVPISSIDSGMVFERSVDWFGRTLTQTAEPRFYYLYVPLREQSDIPVFDSGPIDFNFAQIFSENRYGGADRIGDANQLTAALVSRVIDPETGNELMRGAVGQRYYFKDQEVTLPGETARTNRKTDVLAAFSGRVMQKVQLDAGWQYSQFHSRTERASVGVRWQPEFGKVLNAAYRYTRDQVDQVDISGQWPVGGGWYGVGRYNYSVKDRRLVEGVLGMEYDAGCWMARIVLHRLTTSTATTSTALYLQLELNGLARIGTSPLDLLKRQISGYGVINNPTADPVFGDQ